MRSADATTLARVAMVIVAAYMIILKFYVPLAILVIATAMILDGLDGFLAVMEQSKGRVGIILYFRAALGNPIYKNKVQKLKHGISSSAPYGARMDIAGDRVVEYTLWATFVYLHILPLWILLIVFVRHSFVDAVMGSKGTSYKMKTGIAAKVYSSNIARGGINVVKFLAFSYLALVYAYGYPIVVGYVLISILLFYILLRGAAELYESFA